MRGRWIALVLVVVGLWSLACATDKDSGTASEPTGQFDKEFEVDCIGMALDAPGAGIAPLQTRFSSRCWGGISDTTWGGDLDIWDGDTTKQNWITLNITYGEHTYTTREGRVTVEWDEETKYAKGDYDVISYDEDGTPVRLHGKIDWCVYGTSTNCPYRASSLGLSHHAGFEMPDDYGASYDSSWAVECRALFDPAREAVQVDIEWGVINNFNTALAWLECGAPYNIPPSFTFRSGGVPGPGTYSYTTQVVDYQGEPMGLPGFELRIPERYFGQSCLLQTYTLVTYEVGDSGDPYAPPLTDPTACTFTLEEGDPGRFVLDCANTRKIRINDQFDPHVGDLHIEADCDLRDAP